MINNDFEICDGTTFRDICKEVIDRSQSKKNQIDTLFSDIRGHIKNINDAQVLLPRIKELLDVGVKNDEQLIKLATVVQKLQSTQLESSGGENGLLTDEEKEQLMQNIAKASVVDIKTEVDSFLQLTSSIA